MARKAPVERRKRYEHVAETLIGEIRAGRLAVGDTLPGELELTVQFGVSRHTVREALRRLEAIGLVGRHQGVGTIVRGRQPTRGYVQAVRSPAELLQYPPDSRLSVVGSEEVRLGRKLAKTLGCAAGSRWVRISCLRRLRDARLPVCWVDVYVLPEHAPVAESIGRRAQPVYEILEQRFGQKVATVDIQLKGGRVPEHMLAALEVPEGTPSLTVVRRYASVGGRVFEVSVSEHPADRYTYSLRLERGWQAGGAGGWTAG